MFRSPCRIARLVALLGLLAGAARAQAPAVQITATCLGEDTYRIDCRVDAPAWIGDVPEPGGEVNGSVRIFALGGDLGIPRGVQCDADHVLLETEPGTLAWSASWLAPVLVARFEWSVPPGTIELEYDCTLEYFHHYEAGWDRWALIGADRVQGRLAASLSGEKGTTSVLSQAPLALEHGSWGALKALFR